MRKRGQHAHRSRPYDVLAELYDFVMRHVDYDEWTDHVERVFRHHGPVPRRVVEVACGTGTMALKLADRGYEVHGIDLSPQMIAQASAKLDGRADGVTFSTGDMRDLPTDDFDALICLYDSVNYCLTGDDLRAAFEGFRRMVREDALGIFDVTTEVNSLRYFKDYRSQERCAGFVYNRHSKYSRSGRMQTNDFTIVRSETGAAFSERHEQRIFELDEVREALPATWSLLGIYDDYTLDPAFEESERVHLVMRAC